MALLTEVVEQKSAALPALWNALAAGEEMHHFFGQTPSARTGDSQGALRALAQLAAVRDPRLLPPAQYLANMEEHLQKLAHSRPVASCCAAPRWPCVNCNGAMPCWPALIQSD